ncbi:MAG: N-carbamoylputrescine amidase [Pararhodobacter sp.]|nr:N-carbamoylputrescine amidase [Pararhodobacter sp.]
MRNVTLAATQFACSWDIDDNIAKAEDLVRRAAADGAQIILLQELFQTPYFCAEQHFRHFSLAQNAVEDRAVRHFSNIARELGVVLPISFYERAGTALFNSLTMIDADGTLLGTYRKTHIPQNPGYEEKYYFTPGDTGFVTFRTRFATIGCGICWDQWFPECARALVLNGAEVLLYPTAIGSEPADPGYESSGHWQRVMQGHAGANMVPVVASNRVGNETEGNTPVSFYGTSFITDATGAVVAQADRASETHVSASFDLDALRDFRAGWGTWRDRRPEVYGPLCGHGQG